MPQCRGVTVYRSSKACGQTARDSSLSLRLSTRHTWFGFRLGSRLGLDSSLSVRLSTRHAWFGFGFGFGFRFGFGFGFGFRFGFGLRIRAG